jgi:hypothetical protein
MSEDVHPAQLQENDVIRIGPHRVRGELVGHDLSDWDVEQVVYTDGGRRVVVKSHDHDDPQTVRVTVYEAADFVDRREHHPHQANAAGAAA